MSENTLMSKWRYTVQFIYRKSSGYHGIGYDFLNFSHQKAPICPSKALGSFSSVFKLFYIEIQDTLSESALFAKCVQAYEEFVVFFRNIYIHTYLT